MGKDDWVKVLLSHGWTIQDQDSGIIFMSKGRGEASVQDNGVTVRCMSQQFDTKYILLEWSPKVHSMQLLEWIAAEAFEEGAQQSICPGCGTEGPVEYYPLPCNSCKYC